MILKPSSTIKARLGIEPNGRVQKYLSATCHRHNGKYVPGGTKGSVNRNSYVMNDGYVYNGPYAHYLYVGKLYIDPKTNLRVDILAAGSRIANSSELLSKKSFKEMLEELKKHYDLIFMDCCPISSMTDGVLISKMADGTVYVIESDRVDYKVVKSCIDELKNNDITVLGAVLTKVNIKRQKKLYGYKYDYYYSNYK